MEDTIKQRAINAFILFHLVVIVGLSIPPYFHLMAVANNALASYAFRVGLYQNWAMFAVPPNVNVYVQAEITCRNGENLLWTFPQMYELSYAERYAKERYRKFSNDNLRLEGNKVLWPDAARYIARLNASPSRQPTVVKLLYYWASISPPPAPGSLPAAEKYARHVFFTYSVKPEDLL